MKATATAPKKQAATGPELAPRGSTEEKHGWHGEEVEEHDGRGRHLSETPEAAASRAEGNGPVDAATEARRSRSPDRDEAPRPRRDAPDPHDEQVIEELKRQAAAEEHAATRGGRVVRGPI